MDLRRAVPDAGASIDIDGGEQGKTPAFRHDDGEMVVVQAAIAAIRNRQDVLGNGARVGERHDKSGKEVFAVAHSPAERASVGRPDSFQFER